MRRCPSSSEASSLPQREHHKGGMIGQKAEGLAQFSGIVSEAFRGFKGGFRVPVAEFRLHKHAHFVRGGKGRLRGNMAVEAHAVYPIAAVNGQHLTPALHGHGRMPFLGKHGAVGLAAQEDSPAIQGAGLRLPRGGPARRSVPSGVSAPQGGCERVEVAVFLIPAPDILRQG